MTAEEAILYLRNHVPANMPVFILLGEDQLAVRTILFWFDLAREAGCPNAKLEDVLRCLLEVLDWPTKKLPD